MTTMTFTMPDFLVVDHQDKVRFMAAKLYEACKLSLGPAAEMAGSGILLKFIFTMMCTS